MRSGRSSSPMKDDDIAPPSSALSPELELFFPSPPRTPPPPLNRHLAAVRMRRGPMYSAYTELRDSRLRRKREEEMLLLSPSSFKLARTRPAPAPEKMKMPAVMRSVPNFSAALRKENRDPGFLSPPPTKVGKFQGTPPRPPPATAAAAPSRAGVLRTAGAGAVASSPSGRNAIKSSGGPPARRSYSCLKELKELKALSGTAAAAIEEEGEGGGVCGGGISKRPPRRWY